MTQQALGQAAALELVLVAYLTTVFLYMLLVLRTTCLCSFNKGWVYCWWPTFHINCCSVWHRAL